MLSNPPPSSRLHPRTPRHQHRRQNSTPSAFEVVKIAPLPSFQQQRSHVAHRRGLSLDTRRQQLASTTATTTTRQDYTTVGTSTTNPGLATTQQHVLQEAQQQRTARPGPSQPTFTDDNEAFLLSPHVTAQSQRFMDASPSRGRMADLTAFSFDAYLGGIDITKNPPSFTNNTGLDPGGDFEFFGTDSALSTPTFITFPDSCPASPAQGWISESETASTQPRRASRRISGSIMEKVARFEALGGGVHTSSQRPCTPTNQMMNGCFPQTPVGTPHQQFIKTEPTPLQPTNRFSENYDESMEETIKPSRANKNSNRNSGVFQDLRQQAEGMVQTPPRAGTIPMPLMDQNHRSPEFMNMRNVSDEFVKIERAFNGACQAPIPQAFAQQRDPFSNKPDFHAPIDPESQHTLIHHGLPSPGSKTPSRRSSPHRRAESIASITSAASIADINIEETKTETGVTLDDIAAFIRGPDPSDGKWECLYENCHKRFGRKENIKSHVQTHLNDRQYQCPTCKKCFVRQHDLKRHAKIHTGIKPYPCDCGNRFARHDALTRHRQRGMCIGAFDGIVRKVVKRGRPKKVRPDMEGRLEKSERTRRKNRLDSVSSVSSQSGCSDSSAANSPGNNEFDGLMDEDQFADIDIMDVAMSSIPTTSAAATMNPSALVGVSSAPMPTISESMADVFGTALSPGANHVASPSAMSNYSHASHATTHLSSASRPATASDRTTQPLHGGGGGGGGDYRDGTADQPLRRADSPARSVASHYTHLPGTPPELSTSSSPPPTSGSGSGSGSAQFFDVDPNSSGISDASIGLGTTVAAHAAAAAAAAASSVGMGCGSSAMPAGGVGGLENDMLLQYADHDGLVQLDQSMLLGKFDEDFDGVSMFANGEDVFFGTT